jgi:hypothetical protein
VCISSVPHTSHVPRPYRSLWFVHSNIIWRRTQITKLLVT